MDEIDAGVLAAGATSLIGSGVLQTVQTTVPGGLFSPQCGHSVTNGIVCLVESTIHDTRTRFKSNLRQMPVISVHRRVPWRRARRFFSSRPFSAVQGRSDRLGRFRRCRRRAFQFRQQDSGENQGGAQQQSSAQVLAAQQPRS